MISDTEVPIATNAHFFSRLLVKETALPTDHIASLTILLITDKRPQNE
jgi:hypothetical protein